MPRRSSSRPDTPIALNLARIVFRLLTDPRGWRVRSLMEELDIQPRTYRKYKALLRDHFEGLRDADGRSLICEVREGEESWLRLRDSSEPVGDDDPDFYTRAVTMELARQAFASLKGSALAERLREHHSDFFARVGNRTYVFRELLRGLDRKVFYLSPPPKDYGPHRKTLRLLLRALFHNRRVYCEYQSARAVSSKVLEPLTLILWNGGLYLVARPRGSHQPLLFVVDRFRDVRLSRERFRYPAEAEYSPWRFCDGHFGIFHEDREPVEVELVFAAKPWLRLFLTERKWHPTQAFETLPDGRLRMTFQATCLVEVGRFVRSFGEDVTVVRPDASLLRVPVSGVEPGLRTRVRKMA